MLEDRVLQAIFEDHAERSLGKNQHRMHAPTVLRLVVMTGICLL